MLFEGEGNEGSLDRVVHVAVGGTLLILVLAGVIGPWGLIGAIPLVTGIAGYEPLYEARALRHRSPPVGKTEFLHHRY